MDSEHKSYFKVGDFVNYNNTRGCIVKIQGDKAYLEWGEDVFMQDWGKGWIDLDELLKTNPDKLVLPPIPYSAQNWVPVDD